MHFSSKRASSKAEQRLLSSRHPKGRGACGGEYASLNEQNEHRNCVLIHPGLMSFNSTVWSAFVPRSLPVHLHPYNLLTHIYSLTHLSRSRKYRLPVYLEVTPSVPTHLE